jgi:ribonuclease HI
LNLRIYSDGASRGNPGVSAAAFMILDEDGNVLRRRAKYLGIRTNNQAEYEALALALNAAAQITNQTVTCKLDSELVVKHLNGEYRVKDPKLKELWLEVQRLKRKFKRVTFTQTARTNKYIQEVDSAANHILDQIAKK